MEILIERDASGKCAVWVDGFASHLFDLETVALSETRLKEIRTTPADYGARLFTALFGEPGSIAQKAYDALGNGPARLLLISADANVRALPWEYCHDGKSFVVVQHYFVRGLVESERQGMGEEIRANDIQIVAVAADALEMADGTPIPRLRVKEEAHNLIEAITKTDAPYQLQFVCPPTIDALHIALAEKPRNFVHFMGHSEIGPDGQSYLIFESRTSEGVAVSSREFVTRLENRVGFVFLNACLTSAGVPTEFSNIAQGLVRGAVPYALGMQFTILDDSAVRFANFFYQYIANGLAIEAAVLEARRAMLNRPFALGVPVLYTSLKQGTISLTRGEHGVAIIRECPSRDRPEELSALIGAETFVGRERELIEIGQLLERRTKVVVIQGEGGIGKTALAIEAAQRFGWRFGAGTYAISLEPLPLKSEVVAILTRWLFGEDTLEVWDEKLRESTIISQLLRNPFLLVLDNFETILRSKRAAELRKFLNQLHGETTMLITSREPTGLVGEVSYRLQGLESQAGATVFRASSGRKQVDKLTAEKLSQTVEGHPLALRWLAGEYAEGQMDLKEFAEDVDTYLLRAQDRFKGSRHATLRACFNYSFSKLPKNLARLLGLLSLFRAPVPPQFVEFIFDRPFARDECKALYHRSLLQNRLLGGTGATEDLYVCHSVIRKYVERRVEATNWEEYAPRFGEAYLSFAQIAYDDFRKSPLIAQLAQVVLPDMRRAREWLKPKDRAVLDFSMGYLLSVFGLLDEALSLYEESIKLVEEEGDLELGLRVMAEMARSQITRGNLDEAMKLYRDASDIADLLEDMQSKGAILHGIANIETVRGHLDSAMELYRDALTIAESSGDLHGRATTLVKMASILRTRGNWDGAMNSYEEAKSVLYSLGDLQGQGATLREMAQIYSMRGNWNSAMDLYSEALTISESVGDLRGKAATLDSIAQIYVQRGDYDKAINLYDESLQIKDRIGDTRQKSVSLHNKAHALEMQGDLEGAVKLYTASLAISESLGDLAGESATLDHMGHIHAMNGNFDEALKSYRQSLALEESLGDLYGKAVTLHEIANVYALGGDLGEALALYNQSLLIKEKLGALREKGVTLLMIGEILSLRGEYENSLRTLLKALEISGTLQAVPDSNQAQNTILDLKRTMGDVSFQRLWDSVTGNKQPEWLLDLKISD